MEEEYSAVVEFPRSDRIPSFRNSYYHTAECPSPLDDQYDPERVLPCALKNELMSHGEVDKNQTWAAEEALDGFASD